MVDINLKIDYVDKKKRVKPITVGIVLGASLLLLAIADVGMLFYESRLEDEISFNISEYSAKLKEFKAGKAKSVFDFQNRLNSVIALTNKKEKTGDVLENIEKTIIADVYIDSFEYIRGENKITMNLNSKNYNGMAKQLLSFKSSGYFSEIQVQGSEVKDGLVKFPVVLIIK